jgi:hypothetical protein
MEKENRKYKLKKLCKVISKKTGYFKKRKDERYAKESKGKKMK